MTVLNRIGDRLARIVLPKAAAATAAPTCGQRCYWYRGHVCAYSCVNKECVFTGKTC